jgi:hypothetical protein
MTLVSVIREDLHSARIRCAHVRNRHGRSLTLCQAELNAHTTQPDDCANQRSSTQLHTETFGFIEGLRIWVLQA